MTTPRDDIAGLSERLRSRARRLYGDTRYGNDFDAAATALDALAVDNDQFRRIALDRLDKLTKAAHALGRIQRGDSDPVSIASDVLRLMPWTGSNE
jgi:hypothetical protein